MIARDKTIDQEIIKSWNYLLEHFTPEAFDAMTFEGDLDKYVIGKGKQNRSFCYIVEVELKSLGEIRGGNASKFGLWHDDVNKYKNPKYRATEKEFHKNISDAFNKIKASIAKLIRKTQSLKQYEELDFILGNAFKHKIMYLYNSAIMIPIFILEDIQHFEDSLGLPVSKTYEDGQKQLMAYLKAHHQRYSTYKFMNYLYKSYGGHNDYFKNEKALDDKLNEEAINSKLDGTYISHPVEKAKLKKTKEGMTYYPRNPEFAARALKNADYKCEYDVNHECFIRRKTNVGYTEVHHLIPLAFHNRFKKSLDVPENIVSLCSNCHNEIHYGKFNDKLIRKLFNDRQLKLKDAGIDIMADGTLLTEDILIEMYSKTNKKK